MKKIFINLLLFSIFISQSHSNENLDSFPYFCQNSLESLPIQQGGRVKPLYVHAKETLKFLTDKSSFGKLSSVQVYCLLSFTDLVQDKKTPQITTRIDHVELKKFLGIQSHEKKIPFYKVIEKNSELQMEYRPLPEGSSYKKSLSKLLQKISIYLDITSGNNWLLPSLDESQKLVWSPVNQVITENKVEETNLKGSAAFFKIINDSKNLYQKEVNDEYLLEITYAKSNLAVWALIIILLALGSFSIKKYSKLPIAIALLAIIIQTLFIVLRVIISHRAPVTNMYETVLFSGYGALILSLIIGHFKKEPLFVFVGLCYNLCTLLMLNFAGGMLSSSIGPLVPVLRDNFWLSTHVSTIILSYGALALSWVLANIVLIKKWMGKIEKKDEVYYSKLIYTCIKFGTVLLAAGIILGGVWADYSWGRFWGWDPKETWSLIVLCIYIAILHGKYTSWIPPQRFIGLTALAFMSVMMAWFGVNYILASGLHSYGFSEGGAIFLGTFFLVQIFIYTVSQIKRLQIK